MTPFDRTHFSEVERVIKAPAPRWDKKIAADLVTEMEAFFGKVDTIPQMKQALAIAGYQGLQRQIEKAVKGKTRLDAIRAMAHAMRSFSLGSPGLAIASFRDPDVDNPEYQKAAGQLALVVLRIFGEAGISGEAARHAIRILKSLVRGFVINEMSAPVARPIEYQKSYVFAVEMFVRGLSELRDAKEDDRVSPV
ncbi:MAG: WHG domain-containing protein [Candidatus Afipia apatlaquensis]|uniref:WHG domain-containing protein n=1 Tax=Candidatus Afipia apatlaquensis TaxID=2712852 RepID=A0A7C9VRC3_9BRAD|nr:WHG domain-containing protein [Candidatus Afipia apatlaquensis]